MKWSLSTPSTILTTWFLAPHNDLPSSTFSFLRSHSLSVFLLRKQTNQTSSTILDPVAPGHPIKLMDKFYTSFTLLSYLQVQSFTSCILSGHMNKPPTLQTHSWLSSNSLTTSCPLFHLLMNQETLCHLDPLYTWAFPSQHPTVQPAS